MCTTKEVFILRVHSLYLSLLFPILTSAYPLISHITKYTHGWFRTVKSHVLLAAHPSLTRNDRNGETCFAQVAEDTGTKNCLPPCLLCISHSRSPVLLVLISPLQSLILSGISVHGYPYLFPCLWVFCLTADKVAKMYRGSALSLPDKLENQNNA